MRSIVAFALISTLLGVAACQNANHIDDGQYYLHDPGGKNIYRRSPESSR